MAEEVEALLLALLQGVTEFLPISSSGHLLLGQHFFGLEEERFGLAFDMVLHLGTLIAVVWFFKRDLWAMGRAFARSLPRPALSEPTERLAYLVLVATVPAAVAGFLLQGFLESSLRSPWVVAGGFAISGALFIFAESVGKKDDGIASMRVPGAAVIGLGQVASLIYGVSRSGSTLAFGMLVGLERTEAARFSFLMSIPITAGAIVAEVPELARLGVESGGLGVFAAGLAISAVTAYLTIRFLLAFFARHTLRPFAYYCFFASALVFGLLLLEV